MTGAPHVSTATPSAFGSPAESTNASVRDATARTAAPRGRSWLGTLITLLIGFVLGAGVVAGVALWYLAEGTPDFYSQALEAVPPAERRAKAEAFTERTVELARDLEYGRTWEQSFTQAEVNGWLAEELPEQFGDRIPNGVSDPRVDLTRPGLVRLGFRLSSKRFDGVVSLAVRPEVVGPNRVALHVEGLMAGLFPLDARSFAPQVSKFLDKYKIRHEWNLEPDVDAADDPDGPPVLFVEINPRSAGRAVLEEMEVGDGAVRVAGSRAPTVRLTRR